MPELAAVPSANSTAASPYIEIRGVGKTYRRGRGTTVGETHAIDSVDVAVQESEFVAIVGPSGCGKSTLLRMIAGLHLPTVGDVRIAGRVVAGPQTNLGIVFQSPVLLEWRTALYNVLVQIELRRIHHPGYRDHEPA